MRIRLKTICPEILGSVPSDWYEIDDVIGMGNSRALYFAFPTEHKEVVGKVKLAVEEIYKILDGQKTDKEALKVSN